MKLKTLNFLLILTSLIGYLEWGKNNHSFLFQAEGEILSKLFVDPISVFHPLTVLPMAGQIILLTTLFQRKPGRLLTYTGLGSIGILLLFMFVIGILSLNYKIILSTIPFMVVSVATIKHLRNQSKK